MSAINGGYRRPAGDNNGAHVNLVVRSQDGNEVFFRMNRSTQLRKLMNAYCVRQSIEPNSIAFLFDGRFVLAEQTPNELEMEDGDEINAMPPCWTGASRARRVAAPAAAAAAA